MRKVMLGSASLALVVALLAIIMATAAYATRPEKVTICHVAGLASDPANYVTLTLAPAAVYGPDGHFNENGTPQAGHEQDTLGACVPPEEEPPVEECPEGTHEHDGQCVPDHEEPPVDPPCDFRPDCMPPHPDNPRDPKGPNEETHVDEPMAPEKAYQDGRRRGCPSGFVWIKGGCAVPGLW